jgi:hypothetical protein
MCIIYREEYKMTLIPITIITTPVGEIVRAVETDKTIAELTVAQLEKELSEAKCKSTESQKKN